MATINGLPQEGGGALKKTLLWTNPSPNSSFAGNTINQDISEYDFVMVTFKRYSTDPAEGKTFNVFAEISYMTSSAKGEACGAVDSTSDGATYTRPFRINSQNKLDFYQCYRLVNGETGRINNNYVIPLEVYGLKGEIK